ncbi:NYN domain-containing protein [Microbacterium sp. A1-JK]|uniref:NYN domain-containing protein n=1 Tax=Microbacterium sp. A1-JK TaxID=3177516 RepID=UPI00388BA6F1
MVYIDGYNLYHGMHQEFGRSTLWLDVVELAQTFRPAQRLIGVKYFSAPVLDNPAAQGRQAHYIDALSAKYPQQFTPIMGRYQKKTITCFGCGRQHQHYEEKETDVNIAVTLVADAARHEMDSAIIVSGDSDLAPAVRAVGSIGAHLFVAAAFPPNRVSKHLKQLMPASFNVDRKRIKRLQLPQSFTADGQTFTKPPYWA